MSAQILEFPIDPVTEARQRLIITRQRYLNAQNLAVTAPFAAERFRYALDQYLAAQERCRHLL